MSDATIVAISTPLGEAGIAMVRLSGDEAIALADQVFSFAVKKRRLSECPTHTVHYGFIYDGAERIDEVMVTVLKAPRTYTKEDVVEISCHGGFQTTRRILGCLLKSGARLAEPGEFTRRAFLNGRIDLTQAEAVADLIHARSDRAMRMATDQLRGSLSKKMDAMRDDLMGILAHIEAHIDFPDEDIAPETVAQLSGRLVRSIDFIGRLIATADEGRYLRRGIRTVIVGRPNAGKSSLLNQLLGENRAIVSARAGTTRDTIEEYATVRGIAMVFIDTAGLRETEDEIEKEGIRRSFESIESADLILHVVDYSEPLVEADVNFANKYANRRKIVVANKSDLPSQADFDKLGEWVPVSCETGSGIEDLKHSIEKLFLLGGVDSSSDQLMINARHEAQLLRAKIAVEASLAAIGDEWSLEIVAMELRIAVQAIGEIVGKTSTDDLLDRIFSEFCLGK